MTDNVIDFPQSAAKLQTAAEHLLTFWREAGVFEYLPWKKKGMPIWFMRLCSGICLDANGDENGGSLMVHSAIHQIAEHLATHSYATPTEAMTDIRFLIFEVDSESALEWLTYEPNRKIADLAWQSNGQKVYSWKDFENLLWAAVVEWYVQIADDLINAIMENWEVA